MPHIVHPEIENYLTTLRPVRDPILLEMEALAAKRDFPIVGPDVGALLAALTRFAGATRVLELGSGFGYSAYWFAGAMPPGGVVVSTDTNEANAAAARDFLTRGGLADRVQFHVGEALAFARELEGAFDIVFNDIDKEDYPAAIEVALARLRPGGLFVTDNTLWYGRVAQPHPDATTAAVQRFNRTMAAHPDFTAVVLPLRDGLTVALRR